MSILNIRSGRGKLLYASIKEAFDLPDTATHLTIVVDEDGIYKVSVDYFPIETEELKLQPPLPDAVR